ncbi:MAG: hypothetical protein R2849_15075 [Thermomicrobiales bacterium]
MISVSYSRTPHAVTAKRRQSGSAAWVSLSLLFNGGIYFYGGSEPALEFLTGYLVEKSLAVDNIFVFVLIFTAFAVPQVYQHRVLFWGIIGALVLRGVLITRWQLPGKELPLGALHLRRVPRLYRHQALP